MQLRILDDEVIEAYAETAYRPQTQEWIDTTTMQCDPLTAIIMARGLATEDALAREFSYNTPWSCVCMIGRHLDLTPSYVLGFSTGFDGADQADVLDKFVNYYIDPDDFVEGYQDGKRIFDVAGA